MNTRYITLPIIGLLTLSLTTGCVTKEASGAAIGGALGGIAGTQVGQGQGRTAAIIAGTLAGALLGGSIGQTMDTTDRMQTQNALERTPTGQSVAWQNPDTGRQYTVTPVKTYNNSYGSACREFSTVAIVDGRKETIYGTACRQPDGSWKATN